MEYSIGFKDLSFYPEVDQVIYVENAFDEKVNRFIEHNYDQLRAEFKKIKLDFVYLPFYFNTSELEEKVRYYAPYIVSQIKNPSCFSSSYLLNYIARPENRSKIQPSLLSYTQKEGDEWIFSGFTLDDMIDNNADVSSIIKRVVSDRKRVEEYNMPQTRFRVISEDDKLHESVNEQTEYIIKSKKRFSFLRKDLKSFFDKDITDEQDDEDDINRILFNLKTAVKCLRLQGVALGAIHEFIDKQEPISPLVITEDLRLFLPLYNNIEIELSAQRKALFFLFLNHPEGIVLQNLEEYHSELMNYYKQTNKGLLTPKMERSMRRLEEYGNNQLYVVITRIREAFCTKFDDRLARNYYISGIKGERYRIPLNPDLIKWED